MRDRCVVMVAKPLILYLLDICLTKIEINLIKGSQFNNVTTMFS